MQAARAELVRDIIDVMGLSLTTGKGWRREIVIPGLTYGAGTQQREQSGLLEEASVETVSAQHPNTIRCQCVVPLQRDHVLIRILRERMCPPPCPLVLLMSSVCRGWWLTETPDPSERAPSCQCPAPGRQPTVAAPELDPGRVLC